MYMNVTITLQINMKTKAFIFYIIYIKKYSNIMSHIETNAK